MASAAGQAVFAVVARDAASKVIKGVGKSFGSLQRGAISAFKGIATGALAAAGAVAAFVGASIKGAIEDEQSQVRLNAALKQRGFNLDTLGPKIDAQIKAMQRYGKTDDEVRAGLEVGSRFFKTQGKLLKANEVASKVSAVTGQSLADVMMVIGKASLGQTRGLKTLGVDLKKGASLTQILSALTKQYDGVAEDLANTTSGKALTAQIRFGEAMDSLGSHFLPYVNDGLDFLANEILPKIETGFANAGPGIKNVADGLKSIASQSFANFATEVPKFIENIGLIAGAFDELGKKIGSIGPQGGPLADFGNWLGKQFENATNPIANFANTLQKSVDLLQELNVIQPDAIPRAGGVQGPGRGGIPALGGPSFGGTGGVNISLGFVPDWAKLETVIDNRIGAKVPSTSLPRYYTPGGQ